MKSLHAFMAMAQTRWWCGGSNSERTSRRTGKC